MAARWRKAGGHDLGRPTDDRPALAAAALHDLQNTPARADAPVGDAFASLAGERDEFFRLADRVLESLDLEAGQGSSLARPVGPEPIVGSVSRVVTIECRYASAVIKSFRDADAERLFARRPVRRWAPSLQRAGLRKLRMLGAAERLSDLRVPPGNRLERLSGDRAGQHSIRINDQWRVCFRWRAGDAYDVELVDDHD